MKLDRNNSRSPTGQSVWRRAQDRWVEPFCWPSPIQLGGPAVGGRCGTRGFDKSRSAEHLAPKVGFVQRDVPHRFVHPTKIAQREWLINEGTCKRGVLKLGACSFYAVGDDCCMVKREVHAVGESEFREVQILDRKKPGGPSVVGCNGFLGHVCKCEVRDGHHAHSWVASRRAVRLELFKPVGLDCHARFLGKFALGRGIEIFFDIHKAAW